MIQKLLKSIENNTDDDDDGNDKGLQKPGLTNNETDDDTTCCPDFYWLLGVAVCAEYKLFDKYKLLTSNIYEQHEFAKKKKKKDEAHEKHQRRSPNQCWS